MPEEREPREHKRQEIIDAWANYIGVAGSVRAMSMQKLGVGLFVSSSGNEGFDLTQVGVGASQVLPLLVGVLSAEPESIIAVEQPELHLHPSAQARIADFFLFARSNVTYLIESHSEAMITRIRRRVVEGTARPDGVNILFFERDDGLGGARSRVLELDEYGNLSEWPQGFMDAVDEDAQAIVQAVLLKRRERRAMRDER